ncbi:CHAT domain-containing protein [Streptomyces sp. NPDC007901]|uniref:CHAT domain-containing protein n=1 Tax=Streptomyces sp. NPDC007901 TaxID=3364785 RepID=UPI0036E6A4F6
MGGFRLTFLRARAVKLMRRYEFTGDPSALHQATALLRRGTDRGSGEHRAALLGTYSQALTEEFRLTSDAALLADAVDAARASAAMTPPGYPYRAARYLALCTAARLLFEQTSDVEALEEAIDAGRQAVDASGARELPVTYNALGNTVLTQYLHTGAPDALDRAISVWREALGRTPPEHPFHASLLASFSAGLFHAYRASGDLDLLVTAEEIGREAIGALPAGGITWAMAVGNLGIVRRNFFIHTGSLPALLEAVQLGRDALRASGDRQDKFRFLTNLQIALLTLHARTNQLTLIEEAVDAGMEALDSLDIQHASWSMVASNVVLTLKEYAERGAANAALDEAMRLGEYALASVPKGHPTRIPLLGALSQVYFARFELGHDEQMIREAVRHGELAVAETPPDHPLRAGTLMLLCHVLEMQGRVLHDDEATRRTVALGREAVDLLPTGHQAMPEALSMTGAGLLNLGSTDEARQFFEKVIGLPAAMAVTRLGAYRGLAACHVQQGEPERALTFFEEALAIATVLSPRVLQRADRQFRQTFLDGLAQESAACAVLAGRPERAVELAEQFRGILQAEALQLRQDHRAARRDAPELADEVARLREREADLEYALWGDHLSVMDPKTAEAETQRLTADLADVTGRLSEVLARIRQLPAHEGYLRPLPFARLRRQASDGPVVMLYNTEWRSDALIITTDRLEVLPLPVQGRHTATMTGVKLLEAWVAAATAASSASEVQQPMREVLEWTWDNVTEPVMRHLGYPHRPTDQQPRIWWYPLGGMAHLPLHASGHHHEPGRSVLDRAVSSYATTFRALEFARREAPAAGAADTALIVAMPDTPGQPRLPHSIREAGRIAGLIPESEQLVAVDATLARVQDALPRHRIAHFACHGAFNSSDPGDSRLMLSDHETTPLTAASIEQWELPEAELAFLSACVTALTSGMLADQGIHLASAFQTAGYRQVIGTLWPVPDATALMIADSFYERLTGGGTYEPRTADAACILAASVQQLRACNPEAVSSWAAYIHLGA